MSVQTSTSGGGGGGSGGDDPGRRGGNRKLPSDLPDWFQRMREASPESQAEYEARRKAETWVRESEGKDEDNDYVHGSKKPYDETNTGSKASDGESPSTSTHAWKRSTGAASDKKSPAPSADEGTSSTAETGRSKNLFSSKNVGTAEKSG
ncbi:hypothetical protein CORC01_04994 [Colletotrichum orchidophilum]|uniref:Uncharacterized protein n=1 Tax=Colletotrichum orchidophilum TaxID=1209926 RepID=A0A1G4BE91_9PEZI|nr:uncharacterized protein CORC01_04994 [Colletotrichum orchidophilum]OHE99636.1 hypothetical protein CORC01_04994 [Colletotrichum orchidophilum]